jgi:hypothetical protein
MGAPTTVEATAQWGSIWSHIQLPRSAQLIVLDKGNMLLDAATLRPVALSLACLAVAEIRL